MKPILCFLSLFLHFSSFGASQGDVIDSLSAHFKSGNSKEIASHFSSSVDLIINEDEDVYSKAQAEQILRRFFTRHEPAKSAVIHRLNTNPKYRYGALSLVTNNGIFRVSITMKKTGNAFLITELRIEPEK